MEEKIVEVKERNRKVLVVIIILLIMLVLCLLGYICYNKGIILSNNESTNTGGKEEILDINSALVRSLYYKVSTDIENYQDSRGGNVDITDSEDFYSATASESEKMLIVGKNLNDKNAYDVECGLIPSVLSGKRSACIDNENSQLTSTYVFPKKYVDYVYKDIFGQNNIVDTSVDIKVSYCREYHYIEAFDGYALYGDACLGPVAEEFKQLLSSAVKVGNKIILTQNVEKIMTGTNESEKYKYIFTFEEDNGTYKFMSKVKAQ